jgi:hypothetical protein
MHFDASTTVVGFFRQNIRARRCPRTWSRGQGASVGQRFCAGNEGQVHCCRSRSSSGQFRHCISLITW